MSKWVFLCSACGEEFKIDAEDIPERCPHCQSEGSFEIVDEEE